MAQAQRKTTSKSRKAAPAKKKPQVDMARANELQKRLYALADGLPGTQEEFDQVREELERVMAGEA